MKNLKQVIITLLLISIIIPSNAQDVSYKDIKFKHKKGFVIVEDQNCFKLKWSAGYFYIADLTSGDEVMYIYQNNNETTENPADDYSKVYFTNAGKYFETKMHFKIIMEKLINEGIITSDWKIDGAKIDAFISKYDENITNRTVR